MMSLESYALKILADHGCDCYTYGDETARYLMDDLKKGYPDGMEYPYIDVANAILSISRPEPITRAPYRMVWDTDHECDGIDFDSFEAAKEDAIDTLAMWQAEECSTWKDSMHPTEQEIENYDYMIYNTSVCIRKYNPNTDEYDTCWEPSQKELEEIGFVLYDELQKVK